ncbi:MAG: Gfo/Idh/MocA family oxidoreductase, partial [Promicromonosporaceae bacterium]|nr:Gfo/Idh/MocA family oxidoreductase [Promicromonosporaceae bacterium]
MGKGEKIKVGVFGLGRGQAFLHPHEAVGIEIAAVCDARRDKVDLRLQGLPKGVRGYTEFEDLIASDVDAVILCNYFDEHAPFAIRALRAGKHVMSECASNATVAEGVALCREVERAGKVYMLAENYPFTRATMELRRIYRAGELGRGLYGDGE